MIKKLFDALSWVFIAPMIVILAPIVLPWILLTAVAQLFNKRPTTEESID